jgi:hypothetical protein
VLPKFRASGRWRALTAPEPGLGGELDGISPSGYPGARRDNSVDEAQLTRVLRVELLGSYARAVQHSLRSVRRVLECRVDSLHQIELSVAVGVRTRVGEKRPRGRMQHVRLRSRGIGQRTHECQIEAELVDSGECHAQRRCGRPVAAQALHALLIGVCGIRRYVSQVLSLGRLSSNAACP